MKKVQNFANFHTYTHLESSKRTNYCIIVASFVDHTSKSGRFMENRRPIRAIYVPCRPKNEHKILDNFL